METTPYWIRTAELPAFPSLETDIDVDVAVVGGGLTGITAAYLLKKAGARVALLERDRCDGPESPASQRHITCRPIDDCVIADDESIRQFHHVCAEQVDRSTGGDSTS